MFVKTLDFWSLIPSCKCFMRNKMWRALVQQLYGESGATRTCTLRDTHLQSAAQGDKLASTLSISMMKSGNFYLRQKYFLFTSLLFPLYSYTHLQRLCACQQQNRRKRCMRITILPHNCCTGISVFKSRKELKYSASFWSGVFFLYNNLRNLEACACAPLKMSSSNSSLNTCFLGT